MPGFAMRAKRRVITTSTYPLWRQSLTPWQWYNLSATAMSNTIPSPQPTGSPSSRVRAWNSIAVLNRDVYKFADGGHDDWWGNEFYRRNLDVASPGAPVILRAPTPADKYAANTSYYLAETDGKQRPTSSHTYYAVWGDWLRGKVWRFGIGSGAGDGNWIQPVVDTFDLALNDYDPPGTNADIPENINNGLSQSQNAVTGDVYIVGTTSVWKWTMSTGLVTLQKTGGWLNGGNGTMAAARASCVDTLRNRFVVLGNSYNTPVGAAYLDLGSNTWVGATLTGSRAAMLAAQGGSAAFYHPGIDRYVARASWLSGPSPVVQLGGGEILLVHPETWEVTEQATTGGSSIPATSNGVFGNFKEARALGGCIYEPTDDSGLWFLATE